MKCVKITKSWYKNKYEKNIAQKSNEIDQSPDIELECDNLKNIINYVEFDEVGIWINTKYIYNGLMRIVENS